MNRTTLIDGLLFIVIGVVCIVEAHRLSIGSDPNALHQELRPGLYVFLLGAILLITGVAHLIANRKAVAPATETISKETKIRLVTIVVVLAGYALLIELVGYFVASIPFFFLIFRIFGIKSWQINVVLSLSVAAILYIVFVKYFGLIFPRGILFA